MKQVCINTIHYRRPKSLVVIDQPLLEAGLANLTSDDTLAHQIVSDLEYGVGSRPSVPACFDDEEEIEQGIVDPATDVRVSQWDMIAEQCSPSRITPVPSKTEDPKDDPAPSDPEETVE